MLSMFGGWMRFPVERFTSVTCYFPADNVTLSSNWNPKNINAVDYECFETGECLLQAINAYQKSNTNAEENAVISKTFKGYKACYLKVIELYGDIKAHNADLTTKVTLIVVVAITIILILFFAPRKQPPPASEAATLVKRVAQGASKAKRAVAKKAKGIPAPPAA